MKALDDGIVRRGHGGEEDPVFVGTGSKMVMSMLNQ